MRLAWLLALALCAAEPPLRARPTVDLVISRYNESFQHLLAFVARAGEAVELRHVHLYTHAPLPPDAQPPPAWEVHLIENWGKESYAYLLFMERHRRSSTPSDYVWFSQAPAPGDHNTADLFERRLPALSHATGMMGLGFVAGGVSCQGGPPWVQAIGPHIAAVYLATQGRVCHAGVGWHGFFNGEFIVSKRRLRLPRPWLLRPLRMAFEEPDESPIHADPRWAEPRGEKGENSTRRNPLLGYAMERVWNLLFDCLAPSPGETFQCLEPTEPPGHEVAQDAGRRHAGAQRVAV